MLLDAPHRTTAPETSDAPARIAGVARGRMLRSIGLLVAVGVLGAAIVASIAIGVKTIGLSTVWQALAGSSATMDHLIVRDIRIPRTLLGLLVGVALGIAGAQIQAMTRNPLADPGILGVNAGAGFAVTVGIAVFGVTTMWGYIWFAMAGAAVVTVGVYAIGSIGRGGGSPVRLVLAGIALSAALGGIARGIALLRPSVFDDMRFWAAGSLAGRHIEISIVAAGFIAAGLAVAVVVLRPLNALGFGDEAARSLGVNVVVTRVLVVVSVTLLCGTATAAAGPIGFVGLMVPHVARWFVGPNQVWIFVYTAVGAPILLLVSDIVARIAVQPSELPVGIVTAFVGGPVLIYLVRRRNVSEL